MIRTSIAATNQLLRPTLVLLTALLTGFLVHLPILPVAYADTCENPPIDEPDNDGDECYDQSQIDPGKNIGSPNDDSNCTQCTADAQTGDPINIATGNIYETETDFSGAGPFSIKFIRYYNSLSSTSGPLGAHWSHNFSASLQIVSPTVVYAVRESQKRLKFTLTNGKWMGDADVNARLSQATSTQGVATGWVLTTGQDSTETYDSNGTLRSITLRNGLTQTFSYDASGRLSYAYDPFGRKLTFNYDATGRLARLTDPMGNTYSYTYDAANRLVAVTNPDGSKRQYLYENSNFNNALTGIVDENGSRFSSFTYDANGLAISSEHANGVGKVSLAYDFTSGVTYITDANGNLTSRALQTQNGVANPINFSQPCATQNCFLGVGGGLNAYKAHDTNGNTIQYFDYRGNVTNFTFDTARNLEMSRTEGVGTAAVRTIKTVWHPSFRLPLSISDPQRTITFAYDSRGNLTTRSINSLTGTGQPRTWRYTYNAFGEIASVDGPRTDVNDITSYLYDAKGQLIRLTNALGQAIQITSYDAIGRPTSMTDPNGLITRMTYDYRGNLISLVRGTLMTSYQYDKAGLLIGVTRPDGSMLQYVYDTAHQLVGINDSVGNRIAYTRDLVGNIIKTEYFDPVNQLRQTHSAVYDQLNRLAKDVGAQGQVTAYSYDGNGNLVSSIDPLQNTITNTYDALNRRSTVTDPNGGTVQLIYDANDNVTSVTDPRGLTTRYSYVAVGDQIGVQSPDAGPTARTFDSAGNMKTATDAKGQTTTYTYDALNRPVLVAYADGTATRYFYDQGTNGIGHLTQMADVTGTTAWSYDQVGRLVAKQQTTGAVKLTTNYAYDQQGRLIAVTYPSRTQLIYGYDAAGRIQSIQTLDSTGAKTVANKISYLPFRYAQSWNFGGTIPYVRSFDLDGRLSRFPLGNDTSVLTYDAAGRLVALVNSGANQTFAYDSLDRLTGFADQVLGRVNNYTYDANGNRTASATISGTTIYTTDSTSNRLLAMSGLSNASYTYDAMGNMTADGTSAYSYDARGRLIQVVNAAGITAYGINGKGQRVAKRGNGAKSGIEYFAYDESGNLVGEYDANGLPIQETVWLNGEPIAVRQSGSNFFVYADQLRSPRVIADGSGAQTWRWNSDAFGNGEPVATAGFAYALRFPGQYYDLESGLHNNGFRDYNPALGRYIESDLVGLLGGIDTYAYVRNNPLTRSDILGLIDSNTCTMMCTAFYTGVAAAVGSASRQLGPTLACATVGFIIGHKVCVQACQPGGGWWYNTFVAPDDFFHLE